MKRMKRRKRRKRRRKRSGFEATPKEILPPYPLPGPPVRFALRT